MIVMEDLNKNRFSCGQKENMKMKYDRRETGWYWCLIRCEPQEVVAPLSFFTVVYRQAEHRLHYFNTCNCSKSYISRFENEEYSTEGSFQYKQSP